MLEHGVRAVGYGMVYPLQRAELDHALVAAELNVVATDSGSTLMPLFVSSFVSSSAS